MAEKKEATLVVPAEESARPDTPDYKAMYESAQETIQRYEEEYKKLAEINKRAVSLLSVVIDHYLAGK